MVKLRVFAKRPGNPDTDLITINDFNTAFDIDLYKQLDANPPTLAHKEIFSPVVIPPQPTGDVDKWGIPFFHKSKANGFFYEMSDNPQNDTALNFVNITANGGVLTMHPNGPTSFGIGKNIKGFKDSIGGCQMNFKETAARGYAYKPDDVRDLEFKTLANIKGIGDHGFSISCCTGHHKSGSGNCAQGFSYMFNVDVAAGKAEFRFRKEMSHVNYFNSPEGWFTDPIADFKLDGHGWFGFGVCRYNVGSDSVALEGWFNPNPETDLKNWKMIKRIVDKPGNGWGKGGKEFGGDDDQVGTWSNAQNRLKTNASAGTIDFKAISFREIDPSLDK